MPANRTAANLASLPDTRTRDPPVMSAHHTDKAAPTSSLEPSHTKPTTHTQAGLSHVTVQSHYAAVGLSDGTVLLHHIERDLPMDHVAISPTQQPVQALAFADHYLLSLCADHTLSVVDLWQSPRGVQLRVGVVRDATALTATVRAAHVPSAEDCGVAASAAETMRRMSARVRDAAAAVRMRILIAGPTTALYDLHLADGDHLSQSTLTCVLRFASQGATVDYVWMSSAWPHAAVSSRTRERVIHEGAVRPATDEDESNTNNDTHEEVVEEEEEGSSNGYRAVRRRPRAGQQAIVPAAHVSHTHSVAVMASAEDGVIHVWDVQPGEDVVVRCRRTLRCGQRIANLAVWRSASSHPHTRHVVMATTFTGTVLMWDLGYALLPPVVEPTPLPPHSYSSLPPHKADCCMASR